MEQFETDENLVDQNENREKISGFHCFVIILCSIFALFLFYLLFKYLKKGNESYPFSKFVHSK